MRPARAATAACAVVLIAAAPAQVLAADILTVGAFSTAPAQGPLPTEWQPLTFERIPRHTRYELVADTGTVVVKATSQSAASGLIRRIRIDPREYPVIRWRWKVAGTLARGDVTRKSGDDYAARVYVAFEFDPQRAGVGEALAYRAARAFFGADAPYRALSYIWDHQTPRGTVVPNPYTDRTAMFVLRSGNAEAGTWVTEERNLLDDYRRAFGADPPGIAGIAIMTDTDDTKDAAIAWYGDIAFARADPASR